MLIGEEQIEILQELMQKKNIGFRLAVFMPIGTTVTSVFAVCQVVRFPLAFCSTLTLTWNLLAIVFAPSCRFQNSLVSDRKVCYKN